VPRPSTSPVGGSPLRDEALLTWARTVIDTAIDAGGAAVAAATASSKES